MTPKENFLALLKGEKTDAFVNSWEPLQMVIDPLFAKTMYAIPGQSVIDPWGVTIFWGENEPGPMPITSEDVKVCPDITEWRDTVKAPIFNNDELDWTAAREQQEAIRAQGKLSMVLMATGLLEQTHYLMGFEDALMNLLLEPDDMHDLLDYITEFKLNYAKLIIENLKPDVILFHDDWGSKTGLFMQPDTWREFFKPRYEKIFGYMKSQGVIIVHHADSFCQPIAKDMVDIGMDVWQGVLPQNDIPAIQKETEGKLVLMGGIDAAVVDTADWNEETVRAEVQRACAAYAPGGSFIPCLTYGGEGSIYPEVNGIIMDEIRKLNAKYF